MEPKAKRKKERELLYDARRAEILNAAKSVFAKNGIERSKMTDIADAAEIGIATVYRYFRTKQELVIGVGIDYCRNMNENMKMSPEFPGKNGLQKLEEIVDWVIKLCNTEYDLIRYLQEFDFYFSSGKDRRCDLSEFEKEITKMLPIWYGALDDGKKDGTIRSDICNFDFLTLIFRTIVSLQQRVLTRDYILPIDSRIDRDGQMKLYKDMILCYVSREARP